MALKLPRIKHLVFSDYRCLAQPCENVLDLRTRLFGVSPPPRATSEPTWYAEEELSDFVTVGGRVSGSVGVIRLWRETLCSPSSAQFQSEHHGSLWSSSQCPRDLVRRISCAEPHAIARCDIPWARAGSFDRHGLLAQGITESLHTSRYLGKRGSDFSIVDWLARPNGASSCYILINLRAVCGSPLIVVGMDVMPRRVIPISSSSEFSTSSIERLYGGKLRGTYVAHRVG